MNSDRLLEAAAVIQRNTGINVLPVKQPTLAECAQMIAELTGHLTTQKIAYRKDAAQVTASVNKASKLYDRITRGNP